MSFIKLQICCFILVLYIEFIYIWQTTGKREKVPCNPFFDILMIIVPWLVLFDGGTAWTVNHLETVPYRLNIVMHAIFFLLLAIFMPIVFLHTLYVVKGIPKKKFLRFAMWIPFLISATVILMFLPELEFIKGTTTNYSMGTSVIACYVCALFLFYAAFGIHDKKNQKP